MADQWLETLITATPQAGYELAITLSAAASSTRSPTRKCCTSCAPSTPTAQTR